MPLNIPDLILKARQYFKAPSTIIKTNMCDLPVKHADDSGKMVVLLYSLASSAVTQSHAI